MRAGVLAEFATADAMLNAIELLRKRGYLELETYSPYPVAGVGDRLGLPQPWLPKLIFAGGLLGAVLGYGIQWYANVRDYPHNIGGRPIHSVPAFLPASFEATLLGAAVAAFVGLLLLLRLPALWHPVFEVDGFERASVDRYWVRIAEDDDRLDSEGIRRSLAPLRPLQVVRVEADP